MRKQNVIVYFELQRHPGKLSLHLPKLERRPELDALRGLFLVWMTLTHLPTRFSDFVNQPIGFVSSAEGFVFLSALLVGRLYIRELVQDPARARSFPPSAAHTRNGPKRSLPMPSSRSTITVSIAINCISR